MQNGKVKPSNGTAQPQNGANNVQFIPVEKPVEKQKSPNVNERRISFRGKIIHLPSKQLALTYITRWPSNCQYTSRLLNKIYAI